MVFPVLTADPEDPIEETAKVLGEHKIGAMPVMDDGRLVGIVTAIDMLDAPVRMSGVTEASRAWRSKSSTVLAPSARPRGQPPHQRVPS